MNTKLFYMKAKVKIRVAGISGESQEGISGLLRAENRNDAKTKFRKYCERTFGRMDPVGIDIEYIEIAEEIV